MIHEISVRGEEEREGVERLVLSPEKSSISFGLTCSVFTMSFFFRECDYQGLTS